MNDAASIFDMVSGVLGGLAVFLLGMKHMSDGMQAVAGSRLRRMIAAVTDNRFLACATGAAVTAVIQSSSVTTVMLVGLVNAGAVVFRETGSYGARRVGRRSRDRGHPRRRPRDDHHRVDCRA